nr:MAG TPA: hypothetical protein [Caudoviricetes sp.]
MEGFQGYHRLFITRKELKQINFMESNISRDHIALEAMKVLLEDSEALNARPVTFLDRIKKYFGFPFNGEIQDGYIKEISKGAYKIADAMIAEREKGGSHE